MLSNPKCGSGCALRQAMSALLLSFILLHLNGSSGQTAQPREKQAASPATQTTPVPPPPVPISAAPPIATPAKPRVMIDPAHGGSESGAVLNPVILEKDVSLALAR